MASLSIWYGIKLQASSNLVYYQQTDLSFEGKDYLQSSFSGILLSNITIKLNKRGIGQGQARHR